MNKELKLNCPMCNTEFITTRRDKIWCNIGCSNKYRNVKPKININKQTQRKMQEDDLWLYDLEMNKFYYKPIMKEAQYIRMQEDRLKLRNLNAKNKTT